MMESLLKRIEKNRKEHRRWIALILCLSMVVSLGIFSGLRKDAIAKTYTSVVLECPYMADDAPQVVHTHNDDCYDEYGNLACTLPELEAHTHGDDCYTEVKSLVCGLEENPGHVHSDACYFTQTSLVCGLEESEGHQHTEDCYTLERGDLICENTDEDHEHTDDCFAWNEVLTCGLEAGEGAHVHSDDCFKTERVLTCGLEEGEGAHVHTEDCYLVDRVLTCDKPEIILHTHTDDCYQKNDDGSIYVDEDGYSWLICGQQEIIEHVHDENCFAVYELDDGEPEETEAGGEFVVMQPEEIDGTEADTEEATSEVNDAENTENTDSTTEVVTAEADIEEKDESKENTELTETEENKEEAEDDTKEETESTDAESDVPAVPMPAQSFEKTAGGIKVSVEAPEGAFPENTRMSVKPVNGSGLVDTVSGAVNGEILEVQAVDITFYDADDNEIEPATAIRVSIVPADSQYSEEKANVVHIDDAGEATTVEQAEGTTEDNSEVVFDVETFSIYAIVYTVHFEYEVDGQVYTSSMPGAQDKLLSELIRELNVVSEEQFADFMTKIAEVGISNPEVLKITEIESDWTIRPLKNSEEEEALTIVMQDGATFRITVEAEGITEVRTEDETAVIRTVNDLYLPEEASATAEMLDEEKSESAIAAVQQPMESTEEKDPENADNVTDADVGTQYQVFNIGLENVDIETYDGFNVSVTLPEDAVVGRDFQLYQVKEDGTATDLTKTLTVTSESNSDGLQAVSELSFTTNDFADYVLCYSIETFYTTYEGDYLKITLNYGPKAGIPEGAVLEVREILPEDESYDGYLSESTAKLGVNSGAVAFACFLDIEIQKDGEKIEPKAPVSVKIQMMNLPEETENAEAQLVHFGDQTEVLNAEAVGTDVSFETGSFSVYGVIYTVDFHYEINGQTFEFSIPGGGFISLEHLIEVLGIPVSDAAGTANVPVDEVEEYAENSVETFAEDIEEAAEAEDEATDEGENSGVSIDADTAAAFEQAINLNNIPVSEATRAFVADIATAEFSSPELVWVGKVDEESTVGALKEANGLEVEYSANLTEEQIGEINAQTVEAGDWALVSVRPFVSEESLSVTMKNGDQWTIKVTDARKESLNSTDELNGKTYALIGYNNALLTAENAGNGRLKALSVDTNNLSPDVTKWTFEKDGNTGKYRISSNAGYLNVSEGNVGVSANPQSLNVSMQNDKIRITDDYGFAVNLYDWSVESGFGAWRGNPNENEYLSLYAFPVEIDPDKGYMICVERDGQYYVLKNDRTTAVITSENDLNKLSKEHLWKFEKSGDTYVVHTFGLNEPSTMRIYYGQWGIDAESNHTNYLSVDGDVNNLIISGFGNPKSAIVFNEQTNKFEISSYHTTALKLKEQNRYFFTVSTNNPLYGTVGGTDSDGNKVSNETSYVALTKAKNQASEFKNNNSIQSAPENGYYFDHWELDGVALDKETYPQNLLDNQVSIPKFGSELKAVFTKIQPPSSTDYPAHETPGYEVLSWLGNALSAKPIEGADKTAEVYDYENRIYRVDLTGYSGVKVIANGVDLAFVSDISNSMLFPEKVTAVKDSGDVEVAIVSTKDHHSSNLEAQLEGLVTQNLLEHRGLQNPYILIGDLAKSSTAYAVFYSSGETLHDHYFERGWYALDASYYARWLAGVLSYGQVVDGNKNTRFKSLSTTYNLHSNDEEGSPYIVYEPNDFWNNSFIDSDYLYARNPDEKFGANRLYYLVGSIKLALGYLQDLANNYPIGAVYAGLETFAGSTKTDNTVIASTVGERSTWETRHQDFVQIGGPAANSGVDYENNKNAIIGKLTNITTNDGTAQDIAIQQMKNILHWPTGTSSDTKKFVIMVTDGAPNRNKKVNNETVGMSVEEVANTINEQKSSGGSLDGAELITVGLGINAVPGGQQLLHDIADNGMYYNAQDGNDLTLILLDIIRSIMQSAVVTSDIHDEIDPAFYPVDKTTGLPIQLNAEGEAYIGLDGSVLSSKPSNGQYGVMKFVNNKWQIDWADQVIHPEDKGGWQGTIYVKAKEDFIGGIGIETNLGKATMTPKKYFVVDEDGNPEGEGQPIPAPKDQWDEDKRTPVELNTPRVNVDELALSEKSTEWTVYLGTSVPPREQLRTLYEEIMVKEVVTATEDNYHKQNDGQTIYSITENSTADDTTPRSGLVPEQFALNSLPYMGVEDINWETLIRNGSIENIPYVYEGHSAGAFTIELIKKSEGIPTETNNIDDDTGTPLSHITNKTGNGVEEYTLRITYVPNSDNLDKDYHTGSFGSGSEGKVTDDTKSTNTHVINVFAKKIKIEKVDQIKSIITSDTAEFALYRKATETELQDDSISTVSPRGLPDGKYVIVQTLTTRSGAVTSEQLPLLADDEPYYLVETKAPAGYNMLTEPLKVTIDMTGHNTWTKLSDDSRSQEKPNPYVLSNWQQEATIKLLKLDDTAYDPSQTTVYSSTNDTTDASFTYKIINNSGVELPQTGGTGTALYTILGSILALASGVVLTLRRKKQYA